MIQRAIAMDGTITGEHGVGLKKREYLREELGEETVDAMRKVSLNDSLSFGFDTDGSIQLKQAFDPLGLLNCDKIVQIEVGH
jgi:D-lactate dehydrogenase (cytochrome)